MSNFFSRIANKLGQAIAPQAHELPYERLEKIWQMLIECTLTNSQQSLERSHQLNTILIDRLQKSVSGGFITNVNDFLAGHQIPAKLVEFGLADTPKGFVNEVMTFFTAMAKRPLSILLPRQFIINPLNKLLDSAQPSNPQVFYALIDALIEDITAKPEDIKLFIISESSAPLVHQISQMIVSKCSIMGDVILQLLSASKTVPGLLTFIVTYSPFISTCIDFIHECVEKKVFDSVKQHFLISLDQSVRIAPNEYTNAFCAVFDEEINRPLIYNARIEVSIPSMIYVLSCFTSYSITQPLIEHAKSILPDMLKSQNDSYKYLALRLITLLFEHLRFSFPDSPASVKLSLDFMGLLPPEWYVKSDLNTQINQTRSRVIASLSEQEFIKDKPKWSLDELLQLVLGLLENFMENTLEVNLALTDLYSTIASTWGNDATYFALSDECPDGVYKELEKLCLLAKRRIGLKPSTIPNIQTAYEILAEENAKDHIDEAHRPYINLAILLEFVKEFHAIAQSKNIIAQRETLVI